ncbi:MAG: phosphate ABC transporter permease PstA [Elusimicrobiota bacterium]|jgi:phosphate transport system permease protein
MRFPDYARRKQVDRFATALSAACAFFALAALFAILGYIASKGAAAVNWDFLTQLPKPVGEIGGGIANSIVGTAKIVGLAALLGGPIGILGGIYLSEYASSRTAFWVRYAADALNGVPSIVMGIFAYSIIVLPLKRFSGLAGSIALGVILIPIVLRNTEEFMRLVPRSVREGALALGIPRWKCVLRVALPTAAPGVLTGLLLGISRIAGETAPLIFTAFGNRFWDQGMLHPMASLPLTIYTYAISPYEDWHRQAWAGAFILLMFVLTANILARLLMRRPTGGHS